MYIVGMCVYIYIFMYIYIYIYMLHFSKHLYFVCALHVDNLCIYLFIYLFISIYFVVIVNHLLDRKLTQLTQHLGLGWDFPELSWAFPEWKTKTCFLYKVVWTAARLPGNHYDLKRYKAGNSTNKHRWFNPHVDFCTTTANGPSHTSLGIQIY